MKNYIIYPLTIVLSFLMIISACTEEDVFEDETFSSDQFRVLKVSEGERTLESGVSGISAYELNLQLVFSHEVDPSALESNLSISGNPEFTVSYDSSNSVAQLEFGLLDYESEYTLTLSAGSYGANGESMEEDYSIAFTTNPFIIPVVTLSSENQNPEEGGSTVITANLSETTTADVIVDFEVTGSATSGEDYVLASSTIVVPVGETSASIELTITDDEVAEGVEDIQVNITNVENGQLDEAPEPLVFSIVDNDIFTDLTLKGVFALRWSTEPSGNAGKAVHLRATADIPDLSVYGIGVANNGGGSDSIEYNFPAIAVAAGEDVLLAREDASLLEYFGNGASEFEHVIQSDAMNQNGDDAIELYSGTAVLQTYGDVEPDGTGEPWEYTGSWAYYFGDEWYYGGLDCAASSTTAFDSDCTYPLVDNALQIQGVMSFEADPTNSGSTDRERAIHLRANRDIADLSVYGVGISNNGGGSDGREMDLPQISVSEGDHILFIRDDDTETIATYLGNCINQFDHLAADGGINFNGDDGVELYNGLDVIEVYGNVVDDGTGMFWEYTGSWAVKETGDVYTYGGANCAEFAATNASSSCPYAFCD